MEIPVETMRNLQTKRQTEDNDKSANDFLRAMIFMQQQYSSHK